MVTKIDLQIDQGTTYSQSFDLLNMDETLYSTTGYTAQSQIRVDYASQNVIPFSVTLSNNVVTLSLSANVSAQLIQDTYVYDVFFIDEANNVTKPFGGYITVNPTVTQL